MKIMDKRIVISLPQSLYQEVQKIAKKNYQSASAYIRESVLGRIRDEFSAEEMDLIADSRKSFRAGKGTNWRAVTRG